MLKLERYKLEELQNVIEVVFVIVPIDTLFS